MLADDLSSVKLTTDLIMDLMRKNKGSGTMINVLKKGKN